MHWPWHCGTVFCRVGWTESSGSRAMGCGMLLRLPLACDHVPRHIMSPRRAQAHAILLSGSLWMRP